MEGECSSKVVTCVKRVDRWGQDLSRVDLTDDVLEFKQRTTKKSSPENVSLGKDEDAGLRRMGDHHRRVNFESRRRIENPPETSGFLFVNSSFPSNQRGVPIRRSFIVPE